MTNIESEIASAENVLMSASFEISQRHVSEDAELVALGFMSARLLKRLPAAERSIALVLWARGVIEAAEAHCTITVDAPLE